MANQNYPTAYYLFHKIYKHTKGRHDDEPEESDQSSLKPLLGLEGTFGDIVRFANRYRLAKSFQGVHLDGYREDTIMGYDGLMRAFLAWSAFEQYALLEECQTNRGGVDYDQVESLLQSYNYTELAKVYLANDTDGHFVAFLHKHGNWKLKQELDPYLLKGKAWGTMPPLSRLLSAVRHIFAHGMLTPNAHHLGGPTIKAITDEIVEFLLRVMDQEFSARIEEAYHRQKKIDSKS